MFKYKPLLTKTKTFHMAALMSGNNCIFIGWTHTENVDTILLLPTVNDPKSSRFSIQKSDIE